MRPAVHLVLRSAAIAMGLCCSTPWAETVRQSFPVSSFHSISIKIAGDLHVVQSASVSLMIEAEPHVVAQLRPRVRADSLYLETSGEPVITQQPIRFYVTAPSLNAIEGHGAGSIAIDGLTTPSFALKLLGAYTASAKRVHVGALEVRLHGSGTVALEGSALKQKVAIAGATDYLSPRLSSEDASITIAGSGDALVSVARHLRASISGSGDIRFYGTPTVMSELSGSGVVREALTQSR